MALGKAHRHRTNLRNWPLTAAESAVRGARSSSALDGGGIELDAVIEDPVLAGALRAGQALEGGATTLVGVWQRAPLQALARLHALAAADLADEEHLGRPPASVASDKLGADVGFWSVNGANVFRSAGSVAIGTTNPDRTLHVDGDFPAIFEQALAEAFESGTILQLARARRRPMLYDLVYSALTLDLAKTPTS